LEAAIGYGCKDGLSCTWESLFSGNNTKDVIRKEMKNGRYN
jgi:hypothetical protein